MRLVVGCPVRQRRWVINDWFDHVELATVELGCRPVYAFVGDRADPTMTALEQRCAGQDRQLLFAHVDEDIVQPDERVWNEGRFRRMVLLRNTLLGLVRSYGPDRFLSLDSDILLGHHTLAGLHQATERFDAVGGVTWMSPTGVRQPNVGSLGGASGFQRIHAGPQSVIPVGVIMAIKLMTPAAYNVNYELHAQGEDIGWSAACRRAGVKLGWDNRWPSKHVMSPADLGKVDVRVGW